MPCGVPSQVFVLSHLLFIRNKNNFSKVKALRAFQTPFLQEVSEEVRRVWSRSHEKTEIMLEEGGR